MNVIKVVVTPQKPIEVKPQVKTTQVQIGTDAALGAVTQGVIDLHAKVDELANKQVDIDLSPVAKEQTLLDKAEEIKQAVENAKPEIDTTELAKESTLQELLNRSAHYDSATGNLTIENVNITIE